MGNTIPFGFKGRDKSHGDTLYGLIGCSMHINDRSAITQEWVKSHR
jgi:hypothetical protein